MKINKFIIKTEIIGLSLSHITVRSLVGGEALKPSASGQ